MVSLTCGVLKKKSSKMVVRMREIGKGWYKYTYFNLNKIVL